MKFWNSGLFFRRERNNLTADAVARTGTRILRASVVALCGLLSLDVAARAATPFPLGVYVGNPDGTTPAYEALFEKNFASFALAMGATPKLITTYVDYRQQVASWPSNAAWQAWSNQKSPIARQLTPRRCSGLGEQRLHQAGFSAWMGNEHHRPYLRWQQRTEPG
jgi:hypothetical protein